MLETEEEITLDKDRDPHRRPGPRSSAQQGPAPLEHWTAAAEVPFPGSVGTGHLGGWPDGHVLRGQQQPGRGDTPLTMESGRAPRRSHRLDCNHSSPSPENTRIVLPEVSD